MNRFDSLCLQKKKKKNSTVMLLDRGKWALQPLGD